MNKIIYGQRDNPQQDLMTRSFQLRVETINEEERSVEAVFATETPVPIWDNRNYEIIDEILLMSGARFSEQVSMLNAHNRWSNEDVIGSGRQMRVVGAELLGRLFFVKDDPVADPIWNKVRQKHLKDVSIGYEVHNYVDIPAGKTQVVNGRSFTANQRVLRVSTDWTTREISPVPIGADPSAKIRESGVPLTRSQETKTVNKQLREYLQSLGLRAGCSDQEATEYFDKLTGEQRQKAESLRSQTAETTPANPPASPDSGQRQATPPQPAASPAPASNNPDQIREQAAVAERQRIAHMTDLAAADVPREMLQRAINEGWTVERASPVFLQALRDGRQPPVGGQAPAGHVHGREKDMNARSLAAALLIGEGLDPTKCRMHNGKRNPGRNDVLTGQDADLGDRYSQMSSFDILRECVRLDTGYWPISKDDLFSRAAVSGGSLQNVFTTSVYARLLQGWETIGDTTLGWCDEEDVENFMEQEDISLAVDAGMDLHARGGTAKDATLSDKKETYRIARFSKKFTLDEMDQVDDRLGAWLRIPMELGEAARNLRPDLVYSTMLANPTMTDTGAVFNATVVTTAGGHANLGTGVLGNDTLKTAITAMVAQRLGRTTKNPGRQLNIRPRFIIVPAALEWTARGLTAAAMLAKMFADSSDPWYAALNLIAQEGIRVVADDRIGAIGVFDPRTKATRTGLDTNWFLTQGGPRGLRVAYRRGTGRVPTLRSFVLDQGQWGLGFDIKHDIGVAFTEWMTWYKSTGAGS